MANCFWFYSILAGWSTWQWVFLNFSQNFWSFDTPDTPECASAVFAENEIWNRLKQFLPVCSDNTWDVVFDSQSVLHKIWDRNICWHKSTIQEQFRWSRTGTLGVIPKANTYARFSWVWHLKDRFLTIETLTVKYWYLYRKFDNTVLPTFIGKSQFWAK